MIVNLYYIKGISLSDTPLFDTKEKQTSYFDSHLVTSIDTSYYPPYYYNTIRLETTDCSLDTQANYLSIETNGRRYYYLIGDITYINEDVYELRLQMDTFQTYLFDIQINSCCIDRKFIDRYESKDVNRFNRNYLRENVSNGVFLPYTQEAITGKADDLCWFIIRTAEKQGNIGVNYVSPIHNGYNRITSSYCYYYIPYMRGIDTIECKKASDTDYNRIIVDDCLASICRESNVIDIQFAPFNIFGSDILYSHRVQESPKLLLINFRDSSNVKFKTFAGSVTHYVPYFDISSDNTPVSFNANRVSIQRTICTFYKASQLNTDFNWRFVPALFDNNYINIAFGELDNYASIDSYQWLTSSANLVYEVSPLMLRRYSIEPTSGLYGNRVADPFFMQSMCTVSDTYNCDVINDSWNTWKSANTFTAVSAGIKDIYSYGMNIAGIANANSGIKTVAMLQNMINNVQTRRQYNTMQGEGYQISEQTPWNVLASGDYNSRSLNQLRLLENKLTNTRANNQVHQNNLSKADFPTGLMGVATEALNAKFAPSTVKEIGTYGNGIVSGKTIINLSVTQVMDIEQCGWYYHKNGYLVDEQYNHQTDSTTSHDYLFTYINTRYYYNVLKCSEVSLELENVINDSGVVADIKDRLETGIRLWNVESQYVEIGNYRYDNAEKAYLS